MVGGGNLSGAGGNLDGTGTGGPSPGQPRAAAQARSAPGELEAELLIERVGARCGARVYQQRGRAQRVFRRDASQVEPGEARALHGAIGGVPKSVELPGAGPRSAVLDPRHVAARASSEPRSSSRRTHAAAIAVPLKFMELPICPTES